MTAIETARTLIAGALDVGIDDVPEGGDIFNLAAWDSIGHVRIILAVETLVGRPLTPSDVLPLTNVAAVATFIGQRAPAA